MILYHGTSERVWEKIQQTGQVMPRGTDPGRWPQSVRSHSRVLYLTDAYPLYFAGHAAAGGESGGDEGRLAVLELDMTGLEHRLVPDEDVLAQLDGARGGFLLGETLADRTAAYRGRLSAYRGEENALRSLALMGTCGLYFHRGNPSLNAERVRRVALVTQEAYNRLVMWGHDPSITLANYALMAGHYRSVTRWLFDPDTWRYVEGILPDRGPPPDELREGIEVRPCTAGAGGDMMATDIQERGA
jgi:hypothetical protein